MVNRIARVRAKRQEETIVEPEEQEVGLTAKKGRATPGRRAQEEATEQGNALVRGWRGFLAYAEDVRDELSKVTWPTREEMFRLLRVVLVVLVLSSVTMGVISFLLSQYIDLGLNTPIIFAISFAVFVGVAVWYMRSENKGSSGY